MVLKGYIYHKNMKLQNINHENMILIYHIMLPPYSHPTENLKYASNTSECHLE